MTNSSIPPFRTALGARRGSPDPADTGHRAGRGSPDPADTGNRALGEMETYGQPQGRGHKRAATTRREGFARTLLYFFTSITAKLSK